MFFILTSPGNRISPDSITSTSGRLATSAAGKSRGRATSVMTHPGLTFMMSRTFLPAPEVAVTIMSIAAMCVSAFDDSTTLASGVSRRIDSFSASNFAVSGETSVTSSAARTSSREHAAPIAPVAPTTIALNFTRPLPLGGGISPNRSTASCAAQRAPDAL